MRVTTDIELKHEISKQCSWCQNVVVAEYPKDISTRLTYNKAYDFYYHCPVCGQTIYVGLNEFAPNMREILMEKARQENPQKTFGESLIERIFGKKD